MNAFSALAGVLIGLAGNLLTGMFTPSSHWRLPLSLIVFGLAVLIVFAAYRLELPEKSEPDPQPEPAPDHLEELWPVLPESRERQAIASRRPRRWATLILPALATALITTAIMMLVIPAHHDKGQPTNSAIRLLGSTSPVTALALTTEGTLLLSADGQHVRMWNTTSGQPIGWSLDPSSANYTSVAVSADGSWAAAGAGDGQVELWHPKDKPSEAPAVRFAVGPSAVTAIAFSPDGHSLAIADAKGYLGLWSLGAHPAKTADQQTSQSRITSVAFSPDGTELATTGCSAPVQLWSGHSLAPYAAFNKPLVHAGYVTWCGESVSFNAEGNQIVTVGPVAAPGEPGEDLSGVLFWDVADRAQDFGYTPIHANNAPGHAVYTPDGSCIVTDDGQGIKGWKARKGSDYEDSVDLADLPVTGRRTPIVFNGDRTVAAVTDGATVITVQHFSPHCQD